MGEKENNKRITAIVPAFNEAERIGRVLDVLTTYPEFKEIIVVDDGSTDNTESIVKQYGIHYIKNDTNRGKGYSMDIGVESAMGDIIFFADADVSGLNHQIINEITRTVLDGAVDMFIGMRNRKIYYLRYIIAFVPLFGGERALTKTLWQQLPDYYKHYFRVEAGLNFYAKYYGKGFDYKIFQGLSQTIKERKYGILEGIRQRWILFSNIFSAQLRLEFVDIPKSVRNRRMLAVSSLQSLSGMIAGILFFVATYLGPQNLIYKIFSEELREDPDAPLVHILLYLASITSVNIIMILSVLIFLINLTLFFLSIKKLLHLLYAPSSDLRTDGNLGRK
jgi:glycosyltransferase involved in cell wall biosynthesis